MLVPVLMMAMSVAAMQTPSATVPMRPKFDAFEVATIKPGNPDRKAGVFVHMLGPNRFEAMNYSLKQMIAAAYDLNPRMVSGGEAWVDADKFVIEAVTPGEVRPSREEQMKMLRRLLADRFKLQFHREAREYSIYELEQVRDGERLNASAAAPDTPPDVISRVYPQQVVMPARNVTMEDFTNVLQRAVLDRPVVNKTGLPGRFDFDLKWAPDETQFGGELTPAGADATAPPLFVAVREQLGLELKATKGPAQAFVIDHAEKPTEN